MDNCAPSRAHNTTEQYEKANVSELTSWRDLGVTLSCGRQFPRVTCHSSERQSLCGWVSCGERRAAWVGDSGSGARVTAK